MTVREDPVVRTNNGAVRGTWRGESARFLGIPFAEPPVGALRFAAPVAARPWSGVRDAREHGPTPQRAQLAEVTMIPEPTIPGDSILNVNVFTPAPGEPADGAGLPVLVWVHGGGYTAGSPASPWYDGAAFNRDGVVTVSLSYRLGFDGFGWVPGAPSNRGVRDWLLALEWVRDNIRAFGGDPARVTLAGQSAGGGAVLTLLTLPAAQGLFRGVFSLSGVPADISPERARAVSESVAERLSVPATGAGFASAGEAEVFAAQGAPLGDLPASGIERLRALGRFATEPMPYGPVVDGELVVDTVPRSLASGAGRRVPLVMGSTRDEFSRSLGAIRADLDPLDPVVALETLGVPADRRDAALAAIGRESTTTAAGRVIADTLFRARLLEIAEVRGDGPTWMYDFAWRSPVSGYALHCLDIPFFFDALAEENVARVAGDAPPQRLADEMHDALVRFVVDGDPGWEPAGPDARSIRTFDTREPEDDPAALARVLSGRPARTATR